MAAGEHHLKLQAIPIGKLDTLPKRLWKKKKDHSKGDARVLTGAGIAEKQHHEREAAYNKAIIAKDAGITLRVVLYLESPSMIPQLHWR